MRFTPELLQQLDDIGNATESNPTHDREQQTKESNEMTESSEQKKDKQEPDSRKDSVVVSERLEPRVEKVGFEL